MNKRVFVRDISGIAGFIVGAVVGFFTAPFWEMAPFFVAPVAAVVGAIAAVSAFTAESNRKAWRIGVAATTVGSIGMTALAYQNPLPIMLQCGAAVIASGLACSAMGFAVSKIR